jgi:hypothetical protein
MSSIVIWRSESRRVTATWNESAPHWTVEVEGRRVGRGFSTKRGALIAAKGREAAERDIKSELIRILTKSAQQETTQ